MIRLKAVKIDYPENFGIEKAQREEIMSKVVLFTFQIYHTFDRGELDRYKNRLENNGSGSWFQFYRRSLLVILPRVGSIAKLD